MLNLLMSNFLAPNGESKEMPPGQTVRRETTDHIDTLDEFIAVFRGQYPEAAAGWPSHTRTPGQKHHGAWAMPASEGAQNQSWLPPGRAIDWKMPEKAPIFPGPMKDVAVEQRSPERTDPDTPHPGPPASATRQNHSETGELEGALQAQKAVKEGPKRLLPDVGESADVASEISVSNDTTNALLTAHPKAPSPLKNTSQKHVAEEAPEALSQNLHFAVDAPEKTDLSPQTAPEALSDGEATTALQTPQATDTEFATVPAANNIVVAALKTEVVPEISLAEPTASDGLPKSDNGAKYRVLSRSRTELTTGKTENAPAALTPPDVEMNAHARRANPMPAEPAPKPATKTIPPANSGSVNAASPAVQGAWSRTENSPSAEFSAPDSSVQGRDADSHRHKQTAAITMKPAVAEAQAPVRDYFATASAPILVEFPELLADAGADLRVAETGAHSTATARAWPQNTLPLGQHVIRQIVEITARNPDRPVELTLNPEELGRVRLTLATSDTGVSVSIFTERPETLEILRRNISILAEEFHVIGYRDLDFSFNQRSPGHSDQDETRDHVNSPDSDNRPDTTDAENTAIDLDFGSTNGLDIRL